MEEKESRQYFDKSYCHIYFLYLVGRLMDDSISALPNNKTQTADGGSCIKVDL